MVIFRSDKNYCVQLEDDGDDRWISVSNGYCKSYDCFVGSSMEDVNLKTCLNTAYSCFFPAQYIEEQLATCDDRFRVLSLAKAAYEIDRALELAIDA